MKRRAIYLSTRFPLPATGGRERMILQSLEMLRESWDVTFLYFGKTSPAPDLVDSLSVGKCERLPFPSLVEVGRQLWSKDRSFQEMLFNAKIAQERIFAVLQAVQPEVVIADMIRCGQYVEEIQIPKVLEMDDLLSIRYERFSAAAAQAQSLLGTFSHLLPRRLVAGAESLIKRPLLRLEANRIRRREHESVSKFDAVTLVSAREAHLLASRTGANHVFGFPLGVDRALYLHQPDPTGYRLLYLGNLTVNQNLATLRYVVNNVLPRLDRDGFSYTLDVVGRYDRYAEPILRSNPHIRAHGFVDDAETVATRCHALLAPVVFGTGIKIKILDALACGLPVITNAVGSEGIPLQDGKNAVVTEDPERMAQEVKSLCMDPERARRIGEAGVELVQRHFNRETIKRNYLTLIDAVASGNRRISQSINAEL